MGKQIQETNQSSTQNQNYTGQTNSSSTNNWDWKAAPITAQTQGVIDMANTNFGADPSVAHRFSAMKEDVRRSKMDPMGAYTTPFVRERANLSQILKLGAQEDQAKREDYFNGQNAMFQRKLAAADLTKSQLVNTGGTTTGSASGSSTGTMSGNSKTTTGKDALGNIVDVGMGVAQVAA